ncbi:MAG: HD domain-containing phosphohydrolase, partial [Psychromonas sp.]
LKTTKAVIAIEVSLNSNANILRNNNVSSQPSEIYFFTEKGDLLATSNAEKWKSPSHSPYPLLIKLVESEALNQSHEIKVGSQHYETYLTNVMSEANTPSYLAMLVPKQSLLLTELKTVIYIVLLCLVLSILLSWIFSTPISKALNRLNIALNKAKNEGYKTFSSQPTRFLALNNINTAFSEMSHLIAEQTIKHSGRATLFASLNAQLIDNKTHYNQHNINRFPALTNMLGIAASKSNLTEFSAITLADETQINLFQNTAWANLYHHLSTDQVVNKGSKLDVPYNRIHEIRMRFEVLWRDAEIYYYQQSKANPGLNKPLKEALIKEQLQLMRDFEFIAKVNQGYNKLTARDQLRLQQLSEKTWLRYFDSSMGLSAVEAIHIAKKKQKLPATESLLNNQQADIHGELGELYNLSITQGTATDEQERQAKQQLDSIKTMFNELSNKKQSTTVIDLSMYHGRLSAVPYPENQSDHDLSVTEHIMLLSNIFVTLTSIDSPIKSTLSLSQAIAVLYQISTDKHLDLATFKLFLTSGVYQQYAQQYLHPSQIDAVDIEPYLANEH